METTNNSTIGRIIQIGAGAIGGSITGYLALSGQQVVIIDRGPHLEAIRKNGLKLITAKATHVLPILAVADPHEINFKPDDVVFLCVKSYSTEAALSALHNVVSDIPVFCMQNGVRNEEVAAKYYRRVYAVEVRGGGVYMTPGEIESQRSTAGAFTMGCYPSGTDQTIEAVASVLRSATFQVVLTPDVMPFKWGKLMHNLGTAVKGITNDNEGPTQYIVAAVLKEAEEILAQAKIPWQSDIGTWNKRANEKSPTTGNKLEDHKNSVWQDLARQQGTVEVDYLNGEIVRVAKKLGGEAPLNEKICRIVNEMAARRELPGRYPPAELRKMLGL